MLNRKGIVTTFIIAGILIVSLVIGIYFTKDYILQSEWARLREQPIPEQAREIKDFIDSCIKEVGEDAVRRVGMQAGFVEAPGDPIALNEVNIFSNGLVVGGSLKVPYWLYEQSNGIINEQMPSKEKIQKEISKYIDNNLKTCLGGFVEFGNYKVKDSIIKTETEIQDDKVLFSINYPLHIELKDFYFEFSGFYEKVNVPLGELYDVAKKVYYAEKNNMFLEENTIDWMGQYDEIPLYGVKETCVPPFWLKGNVIKSFKDVLFNNVQFLKLKGSNYALIDDSHERFVLGVSGKDIDANFMFSKEWPFYLEVIPEESGLLKAQSITKGLGKLRGIAESFVCLSTWQFVYNVKYPVLITLSKDDYVFQFASHVLIDRNEPRKNEIVVESTEEMDKKFCENERNEITVYTVDENGNPLNNVDVSYKCITHKCDIGLTELDEYGDSSLTKRFPMCINGAILASKEGYHTKREIYSSTEPSTVTLELELYRTLGVDVVVSRAGSGEVREEENVLISMQETEKDYGVFVNYPDSKEIQLIPGNYEVSIYVMSEYPEGINIPSKTIRNCFEVPRKDLLGLVGETKEKCVDTKIPGVKLNKIISGYAEFNLDISEYDLLKNKIKFYVPYDKPASLEEYSSVFESKEVIKPKFENV